MKTEVKTKHAAASALSPGEGALAAFIGALLAVLYTFGVPGTSLRNFYIGDIGSEYITLYGNFLLTAYLCAVLTRLALPRFRAGFRAAGFLRGWRAHSSAATTAFLVSYIGLVLGLRPFDVRPEVETVLIDGVFVYFFMAMIEEFIYRGLLLRALERLFDGVPRLLPVLISALLFTAGQLPGLSALSPSSFLAGIVWSLGLGLFLGAAFLQAGNLWLSALFHFLNRLGALALFFTTQEEIPTLSFRILIAVYAILGVYGIYLCVKKPKVANDGKGNA